jgi:phage-related protein
MMLACSQPALSDVSAYANIVAYSVEYFNERVLVLHAFLKTTEATPEKDVRLARRRAKEVRDG